MLTVIFVTIVATLWVVATLGTWAFVALGALLGGGTKEIWAACYWALLWPRFWWRVFTGKDIGDEF